MRKALLRFEALWWMTRIHLSNINIWPAVFGGIIATEPLAPVRIAELALFVACAGGALFIVNDILDAEGDEVTAPYLPLPSKLVTLRQAWLGAAGYLIAGLVALALACGTLPRFGLALVITAATALLSMAYSKVKDDGIVASVVISIPQTAPAVIGWLLAGGGRPWALAGVVAYHVTGCISNNILAALRDVDLDPVVGNRTLPVRIGAAPAFRLAAIVAALTLVPLVGLIVAVPGGWKAIGILIAAVAVQAGSYRRTYATFTLPGRGRVRRMGDLKIFKSGEYLRHVAVAAVFSLPVALIAGLVLFVMLRGGGKLYSRRLIDGGLRAALVAATPVRSGS